MDNIKIVDSMTKKKRWLFIIAMCMASILACGDQIIIPITNNIYQEFPNQIDLVNFFISGEEVITTVVSLLVPAVMNFISRKKTLVCAALMYLVSCLLCVRVLDIRWMIAWRVIYAISEGFCNVSAIAIITSYIGDDKLRATVLGYFCTFQSLACSGLNILSGVLAVKHWTNSYNAYWIGLPILVLVILFVPEVQIKETKNVDKKEDKKEKYGKRFYEFILFFTLYYLSYFAFAYFVSVYVAENNLGNEAFAGLMVSIVGFVSMVPGVFLGKVVGFFKNRTMAFAYCCNSLMMIILYLFRSRFTLYIAAISGGLNITGYMYALVLAPKLGPEKRNDTTVAIMTAVSTLALSITTYVVTGLESLFKTSRFTDVTIIFGIMMAIVTVLEVISSRNDGIALE